MRQKPRHAKALYLDPNANPGQVEGNNRNSIPLEEEGVTMTTSMTDNRGNVEFATDIHVGNKTVFATDGSVWAHTELGALEFTPEQACAFAVALQAVAVHVMEQQHEEVAA